MLLDPNVDWAAVAGRYFVSAAACWTLYSVVIYVYRLTLHPLANYPGPKFAAASYLYEFWYDVVLDARYTEQIGRLHKRYGRHASRLPLTGIIRQVERYSSSPVPFASGPLIRINPHELHCSDPNFVDVVYPQAGNRRRNKTVHQMSGFGGLSMSTVATIEHAHHRMRRTPLNNFFSKGKVLRADDSVHQRSRQFCDKLLAQRGQGWFDAGGAFSCFTTDAIVDYCYGENSGFLDQEGWEPNCKDMFEALETRSHFTRHLPWVRRLLYWVPLSLMKTISATYDLPLRYHVQMPEGLKRAIAVRGEGESETRPVFNELLNSELPPQEKEPKRLAYDSNGAALAGPQSTATTLSNIVYHLIKNPEITKKLREELQANIPDPLELPSWPTLEKLPYLSAVILEGLRLIFDFTQERLSYEPSQERLARVALDEELQYTDSSGKENGSAPAKKVYTIPRGTAVGMSACLVHVDETIFPEPEEFRPERWLDDAGQRHSHLDRHMLSFSKGSRFCVGFQIAYLVMYVNVAELALRVLPHLELRDRSRHGVEQVYNDRGEKEPKKTTKGYDLRIIDV